MSHIGKSRPTHGPGGFSLPVHIPAKNIHVGDCLTFSSPPLPGKSSLPVILYPGAQLTLPVLLTPNPTHLPAQALAGLTEPSSSF